MTGAPLQEKPLGSLHSIQSLGAVDGPGLRAVVFLQGCPLRCLYCHNPDTWAFLPPTRDPQQLAEEIAKYKPYFGTNGGVTLSGGEPLSQPEFAAAFFSHCKALGIHTALDTSGICDLNRIRPVLAHTDLVLCDIKFATQQAYQAHCLGSLPQVQDFLSLTQALSIPLWVRHVVVPGLNDTAEDLRQIQALAQHYTNLEKIQWLPFHNLCKEKYQALGIPFPLDGTPAMEEERLAELQKELGETDKITP